MPAPALSLTAGVRYERGTVRVDDHYVDAGNPDDSGRRAITNTSPVLGAVWHVDDRLNVYANYGQGFETPTFAELAYRPVGTGLNLGLNPATSNGVRGRPEGAGRRRSIGSTSRCSRSTPTTRSSSTPPTGGRTTYKNAGEHPPAAASRLAWDGNSAAGSPRTSSYTWLRAEFTERLHGGNAAASCRPAPGSRACRRSQAYGEIVWHARAAGLSRGVEVQYVGQDLRQRSQQRRRAGVHDRQSAGRLRAAGRWRRAPRVRPAQQLHRLSYVGSVIVGDTNGRYFESAPGRNSWEGVSATVAF